MTTIESVDNDNSKLITVIMIQLINLKLCVIIIGELYELQRLQRATQPLNHSALFLFIYLSAIQANQTVVFVIIVYLLLIIFRLLIAICT